MTTTKTLDELAVHASSPTNLAVSSPINSSSDIAGNAYASTRYRYYVLAVLTLVYSFNFIDRQLLVILQEPVKRELALSDTQLGLLTGFTFALFYVLCGIPIARWADIASRRSIIAASLTIWSLMTAVCGFAQTYVQLLLARVGVGVGEAGGSPPAHSMISDIFSASQRATALSIYSVGVYIGILAGFLFGGWLGAYFGWRTAFLVVGLPGVVLALVMRFTVQEPVRGWSQKTASAAMPTFTQVMKLLWSRRSFRHIAAVAGLQGLVVYGVGNWLASYFLRTFHIGIGELGTWLALAMGCGGGIGTFLGGWITDRLGAKDKRWYLWIPAAGILAAMPVSIVMLTMSSLYPALLLTMLFVFLTSMYFGPILAVTHGMVGLRMRALSSAVVFFVSNLIGLGVGPTSVGIMSDALAAQGNQHSLRYAMLSLGIVASAWCGLHYFLAAKTVRNDLANAPN